MIKLWAKEKLLIGVAIIIGLGMTAFLLSHFNIAGGFLAIGLVIFAILAVMIFKKPELGFLLIVFFLPFERVPTFNLGGVDVKINTALGFLTLLAWVLALMFNPKKYKVAPYAITLPVTLFAAAMLASLSQAQNFSRAIEVLIFIFFTIALSVLTVNMTNTRERLKKTIQIVFFSTLVVCIFGLFQFAGNLIGLPDSITLLKYGYGASMMGFPRVMSFSMEPLFLANFLLIPLFTGLALFFERINLFADNDQMVDDKKWWWLVALIVLMLLIFVMTVSRGAYLGFAAAAIVLLVFMFRKIVTLRNVIIFAVTIVIVGYGVAFGLSKGDPAATNNFITHILVRDYAKSASVQERLITYKAGLDAVKDHPILGVGIGNYGPWIKYYPPAPPAGGWPVVNNEFLEVAAETGIVGFLAFCVLLFVIIFRSWLAWRYAKDPFLKTIVVGLLAAFIGVLVQYNFFSTLYIIHIWVLIGLLVATQTIILRDKNKVNIGK